MKSDSERYLQLLERRLEMLAALTRTLADSRADFISLDLEAMHGRIREQQQFCSQIQSLDKDITSAQVRCAQMSGLRPRVNQICWPELERPASDRSEDPAVPRIHAAMQRIAAAQLELKRLNDAHQALLRRSRRSVGILLNLFQSHAPTYASQPAPHAGTLCEERV